MKNLPKIKVSLGTSNTKTLDLISAVQSVKTTGDPDAGTPPVTDADQYAAAAILQTIHNNRNTNPPTSSAAAEKVQFNISVRMYNKVGAYIEGVANDVAVAAGDVAAGIAVVNRTGYKLKKKTGGKRPDFGVVASGPNFIQCHVKKVRKGTEGHLWRFAITTAKGVAPAQTILVTVFTIECDVLIQNIPSGSILAIQHASVVPVSHNTKTTGSTPVSGKVSAVAQSKTKHPIFSFTSPDSYTWTDFLYVVIQ